MAKLPALVHNWWLSKRLVTKHVVIILLVTLTVIPATFGLIYWTASTAFLGIESRDIAAQTKRAETSLKLFEDSLSNSLGDYSYWDDSFEYTVHPSKKFEDSTLAPFTFKNMGVDLVTYVRFDHKVIFAEVSDPETVQFIPDESARIGQITSSGTFFDQAKAKQKHLAYIRTDRGLYVLYSQWVSDTLGKKQPIAFMVMGKLLDTTALSDALQADAKLNLKVTPDLSRALVQGASPALSRRLPDSVKTSLGLFGQDRKLMATVDFKTPRSLIIAGRKALVALFLGVLGGLGFLLWMLSIGIRKISVRRIQALQAYVANFTVDGKAMPSALTQGSDEIAALGQQFNALADKLCKAEEAMRKNAYVQGKADSAAGMLHNVRNALAPIRIMQEKWLAEETLPYRQNLARAVEELAREDLEPSRKADLEQFMISVARKIALSSSGRLSEMEETKSSIDQIAEILGTYDFDTSGKRSGEPVNILALLRQEGQALSAREGGPVELVLPEQMPSVAANRVHLVQILGNVFVNAHEAMMAAGANPMQIIVSHECGNDGDLTVKIKDNGDGVDPAKIPDVFQRGYSTRDHKAGGLGMHWSANAVRAMGGSISLESEGMGKGATLVLTLKLAEPAALAEPEREAA